MLWTSIHRQRRIQACKGAIRHQSISPAPERATGTNLTSRFKVRLLPRRFRGWRRDFTTLDIDFAELVCRSPGERLMDIVAGDKTLASKLDVLQAAGGYARPYRLTATVEHLGDAIRGPLAITFNGAKGDAILNSIVVKNASGDFHGLSFCQRPRHGRRPGCPRRSGRGAANHFS